MPSAWENAKLGPEAFDFSGRSVLVMGAGWSVGRAIALAFAEAGADVALTTATPAAEEALAVKKLASEVTALGRRSMAESVDMSLGTAVQVAIRQVAKEMGAIDVLVAAPELFFAKPADKVTDAEWSKVLNVNLSGIFFACRGAAREMLGRALPPDRQRNRGRIIAVASALGERGIANSAAYSAAKGGVHNLVRALAQEWAPHGITVNCIAPAWLEDTPGLGDPTPDVNQLVRYIPLRRPGSADEMAPMALWLASDASGYVTGQAIAVDGGLLCHL
jgi:NAD(P)-dependent dehydrogenase (short-subunit alcohol dehydrogenase family)